MRDLPTVIAVLALLGCAGGDGRTGGVIQGDTDSAPSADDPEADAGDDEDEDEDEDEDDADADEDDADSDYDPFEDDDQGDESGSTTGRRGDSDTDDGGGMIWFADRDGDGYGDEADAVESPTQPEGYVAEDGDCDDADEMRNPGLDEICDTIDNDCDEVIDELAPGNEVCWGCLNLQQNGYAVVLCPLPFPWEAARDDCRNFNTELVTVDDATDREFLRSLHPGNGGVFVDRFWIGLSDITAEGSWQWADGSAVGTTYWDSGEPNNDGNEDCVELWDAEGNWNDNQCDSDDVRGYICRAPHEE